VRWTPELIRFLLCVAQLCVLLVAGRAAAEPLRAVVRIAQSGDQALHERVRGQASDLEVVLVPTASEPVEETRAGQLARARELGVQAGAQAVVWFVRTAMQLEVLVADLAAERLLARVIERGEGELVESAQEEAAALIVRSALRASLLGTPLGTPEVELAAPPPPPPVIAPPPPPAPERPPPPAPAAPRVPRFRLGAGVRAARDGASDPGRLAATLRLGWSMRALELGVRGAYGFGAEVDGEVARIALAQHAASLYGAYAPRLHARVQLVLEGGFGLRVFTSDVEDVEAREPALDARGSRALLPAAHLDIGLRVAVHAWLSIALAVGMDVLSKRLALGYEREAAEGERFAQVGRLWLVQPHALFELVVPL
jgi:hypothetical protein